MALKSGMSDMTSVLSVQTGVVYIYWFSGIVSAGRLIPADKKWTAQPVRVNFIYCTTPSSAN